jgi:DEAD/DEAH box helicase/Helicase conserved C-terminal domain
MPNTVDPNELRAILSDPNRIRENSFAILHDLCCFVGSNEEPDAQDMLLRAMEQRESFVSGREILDGLLRQVGLFQYLQAESLPIADQIAYEVHRPINMDDDIVFHRPQADVYRALLSGENVVLSAPTSFGKSLIIDGAIASGRFNSILIVVPTIALIDETRRRLTRRFRDRFKIVTHGSQARTERNIFVATQERVLQDELDDPIDLLVVDEFYKLSPARGEDDRSALLNQVVYRMIKRARQFYMLGPNVLGISPEFGRRVKYKTFFEPYRTVVSELHYVNGPGTEFERLTALCQKLDDATLIFCRSPARATAVVQHLIGANLGQNSGACREAADWIARHYHPDWHFGKALRLGIGVHHGRIPRALGQFAVRAFNNGDLKFLACTSTLIEGVNTKAKNIIIFDHEINRTAIDLFTFNNIRGRAGRMREHFVGHVYLFHPEPEQELPLVDMPAFTQAEDTPESLLMQIDDDDLTPNSLERLSRFLSQSVVDYDTLKANNGIDPQRQLNVAREIRDNLGTWVPSLRWSGLPTAFQVQQICDLLWRHFDGGRLAAGSVRSSKQLAYLVNSLRSAPSIGQMIQSQIGYIRDADETVERVLDFLRLWANFHFPRLLRTLDRIQKDVLSRAGFDPGDFEYFARSVENYFLEPEIVALDEYGIPIEVGRKLRRELASQGGLDATLAKLRALELQNTRLDNFERVLVAEAQGSV